MAGIPAESDTHSGIVIARIEPTLRVTNQNDLGELFRNHVGAAIGRSVVDTDHFKADVLSKAIDGFETVGEKLAGVVIGNDDGEVEQGSRHTPSLVHRQSLVQTFAIQGQSRVIPDEYPRLNPYSGTRLA